MHRIPAFFTAVIVAQLYAPVSANPAEDWFNDDAEFRAAQVNEGQLTFLAKAPDKPVHHHQNRIILSASSLKDGWAALQQCHHNIDPVASAQIVYSKHRTRNLSIVSSEHIGRAWVEGHTVQLENIGMDARLCVKASSRALTAQTDGSYHLNNGPFMRRFLDGFYPMHVSVDVELPKDLLRFDTISPIAQEGFEVRHNAETVSINTWFEGKLRTVIRFLPAEPHY